MNGDGTLSRDYLAAVQQTLATLHLWEQSIRAQAEQAGLRRFGPAGEGEPIQFQPGLTDAECDILAKQHGLLFPPDLRSFLQYLLPIRAQQFPNWREDAAQELTSTWDSLLGGIWGDIDPRQEPYFALNADTGAWEQVTPAFQPRLWLSSWGPQPQTAEQAYAVLHEQLARAPRLLRLFGHRFLPATPRAAGNPVFSIVRTDIIVYGNDLSDYFAREFGVPRPRWAANTPRTIPFWSELVALNGG